MALENRKPYPSANRLQGVCVGGGSNTVNIPQISVILPTHNRANVLARSIRSVLAQTFSDLELVVVDDASIDATKEIVASFTDSRIRYIRIEQQSGAAVARNLGVQHSTAPLLAFQDSDDEWLVDKLRCQIATMQQTAKGAELVCGGYFVMPRAGKPIYVGASKRMQMGDWGGDNIYDFCFITPTWLIQRSALASVNGFDEKMPNLEDWELSFRLFRKGVGIVALDQPMLRKYGGTDSLNWEPVSRIRSLQIIIKRHADMWQRQPVVLARLHEELGRLHCRMSDMPEGRSELRKAVVLDPHVPKRWLLLMLSYLPEFAYRKLRLFVRHA